MGYYPGKINDAYIKEYISDIVPDDSNGMIKGLEDYALKEDIPIVEVEVKRMLEVLIKASQVKSILEVGTAIGYSSLIFARAMNYEGYVKSYEIDKKMHQIAMHNHKRFQKEYGIYLNIDLVLSDAKKSLEKDEDLYDMVFIDAAKGHYQKFYDQITNNLKKGSIIVSDNVLFKGMIATDEYVKRRKITIVKRMRNYIDFLMNHENLTTTVIPIGDGVAISYYDGGKNE
jgi:predicted O-methyltransferase YrrM